MKVYQSNHNKSHLYFENPNHIDEESLFDEIVGILREDANVTVGQKQIGPSEDYYKCKINGNPFTLFYDIDDGALIHTNDMNTMQELIELFEE